jgi:hypothetical protein
VTAPDDERPDDEYLERVAAGHEALLTLGLVEEFLTDYVVFSSEHEACAVALWVLHTYLLDEFEVTPRLVVRSPSKQAGKSLLLECLEMLV